MTQEQFDTQLRLISYVLLLENSTQKIYKRIKNNFEFILIVNKENTFVLMHQDLNGLQEGFNTGEYGSLLGLFNEVYSIMQGINQKAIK